MRQWAAIRAVAVILRFAWCIEGNDEEKGLAGTENTGKSHPGVIH